MFVEFTDVGRDKKCWTSTIKGADIPGEILRAVRKSGAIMSRSVDVEVEIDGTGIVVVTGFRVVGAFVVRDYVLAN